MLQSLLVVFPPLIMHRALRASNFGPGTEAVLQVYFKWRMPVAPMHATLQVLKIKLIKNMW